MHADTGDGHLAVCVDCAEAQGEMGIRFYTKLKMAITTAKDGLVRKGAMINQD